MSKEKIYKSVYFFHVRKAGGTSINYAFLKLFFGKEYKKFYRKIGLSKLNRIVNPEKKVIIGWNRFLINFSNFSYAWSHHAYENLMLNSSIFKFVILRDPVERIISYYKEFLQNKNHPAFKKIKNIKVNNIIDFISLLPDSIICNQMYLFSKKFNLLDAKKNLNKLNLILFQKDFKVSGYRKLEKILNIKKLKFKHERKSKIVVNITKKEKDLIKKKVQKDYLLYNYALKYSKKKNKLLKKKFKINIV